MKHEVRTIPRESSDYPGNIEIALAEASPVECYAIGNLEILYNSKIALFCSTRCPGRLVLATYDLALRLRADGRTIISGFHSPMEKECLKVLLRSPHPIIICPARGLESMRIPSEWRRALVAERLLILSRFDGSARRATATLAQERNTFVAALADFVLVAHAAEGSKLHLLAKTVISWGRNLYTLQDEANTDLLAVGATPYEGHVAGGAPWTRH